MAQGYRFVRPNSNMFYQPTGLAVSALRQNSCLCVRHCLSDFPTILCVLPEWSRKLVRCIPFVYLERKLDLRRKVLSVQRKDRKTVAITTTNDTKWTCSIDSQDICEMAIPRPLTLAPVYACLKRCCPSESPCGSHGFRMCKHFDLSTMQDGLCTLSGSATGDAFKATICKQGSTPCAADEQIRELHFPERKLLALGYRYYVGNKWLRALPIKRPL